MQISKDLTTKYFHVFLDRLHCSLIWIGSISIFFMNDPFFHVLPHGVQQLTTFASAIYFDEKAKTLMGLTPNCKK